MEVEQFNTLCYPGTDSETKGLFVAFVKRLRDDEGKKITCVLTGQKADYEGIINVKNGVVLEGGETLPPEKAVAWVCGATAAAEINESLTNTAYDGAVDVARSTPRASTRQPSRPASLCSTLRTSRPVSSPTSTA